MWKHKWLIVSLVLAVFLIILRYNQGVVQQDNYVGYAQNEITFYDSRLFPGLPILIKLIGVVIPNFYVAGYIVTLLSFIGSYFLLYKITGSRFSVLPLVFPPILLSLATLIDTEFPFIFLSLLGYYLIKKEKMALAFVIIGLSVWFRLAALALIFAVFMYFLIQKKLTRFFVYLPYFALPIVFLMAYNVRFFGAGNLFYQLTTYEALHPGRISIGVFQLGLDLVRAVRWHWYRIFISGLFYVIFFAVVWVKSIKLKSLEFWLITGLYLFTLIVNIVPFLENLGRYLAPTIPFFWIMYHGKFKKNGLVFLSFVLFASFLVVLI